EPARAVNAPQRFVDSRWGFGVYVSELLDQWAIVEDQCLEPRRHCRSFMTRRTFKRDDQRTAQLAVRKRLGDLRFRALLALRKKDAHVGRRLEAQGDEYGEYCARHDSKEQAGQTRQGDHGPTLVEDTRETTRQLAVRQRRVL